MRLNWFLSARRKTDDGPAAKPGLVRRVLRKIAPTWVASPLRRLLQTGAFFAFLGLFLYVCWPYTARPAQVWHDWLLVGFDPETGRITLTAEYPPAAPIDPGATLHLVDQRPEKPRDLGPFRVTRAEGQQLELEPADESVAGEVENVRTSLARWSLHQAEPDRWSLTTRGARLGEDWFPGDILDADMGKVPIVADPPTDDRISQGSVVHVEDRGVEPYDHLGAFRIVGSVDEELVLQPAEPLTPEQLDRLLSSIGPWALYETIPQSRPRTSPGARVGGDWMPVGFDPENGRLALDTESLPADPPGNDSLLILIDRSTEDYGNLGPFRVVDADEKLVLEPAGPSPSSQREELMAGFRDWSLGEKAPGSWPSHYADELQSKETIPAETFLALDPLVSLSTALAAKVWVWSLAFAAGVLLVCLVVPRGFCAYLCPLGTLIDLFDWVIGKPIRWMAKQGAALIEWVAGEPAGRLIGRLRLPARGWWSRLKYYLLAATLAAAVFGVLVSGFVAAIPLLTRALAFLVTPLQTAGERDWYQVPAIGWEHWLSIGLFCGVLILGLLRPRFWCRYVCPSGAVFSVANRLRLSQRKVDSRCIRCGRCVEICPFDAIEPDFSTRTADCTFCQSCGGVCPTRAIQFVGRWTPLEAEPSAEPATDEPRGGRRGFLRATAGVAAGAFGGLAAAVTTKAFGAKLDAPDPELPVRPPGSVPEKEFLQLCVRCGECFQACPNDVLQPLGLRQGIEGIWTPEVVADWSGCEPSCNNCGQVCPTGAIRALSLEEKRRARMGLAVVDEQACLPYAHIDACQLCVDECNTAGYRAIEFEGTGARRTESDEGVQGTTFLAPKVLPGKCVGCGLCQTRCYAVNVAAKGLLEVSAIRVEAGEGKEDRMMSGSYVALREKERQQQIQKRSGAQSSYLIDDLK